MNLLLVFKRALIALSRGRSTWWSFRLLEELVYLLGRRGARDARDGLDDDVARRRDDGRRRAAAEALALRRRR